MKKYGLLSGVAMGTVFCFCQHAHAQSIGEAAPQIDKNGVDIIAQAYSGQDPSIAISSGPDLKVTPRLSDDVPNIHWQNLMPIPEQISWSCCDSSGRSSLTIVSGYSLVLPGTKNKTFVETGSGTKIWNAMSGDGSYITGSYLNFPGTSTQGDMQFKYFAPDGSILTFEKFDNWSTGLALTLWSV